MDITTSPCCIPLLTHDHNPFPWIGFANRHALSLGHSIRKGPVPGDIGPCFTTDSNKTFSSISLNQSRTIMPPPPHRALHSPRPHQPKTLRSLCRRFERVTSRNRYGHKLYAGHQFLQFFAQPRIQPMSYSSMHLLCSHPTEFSLRSRPSPQISMSKDLLSPTTPFACSSRCASRSLIKTFDCTG